ncbi:PREDICTED: probable protein S-acyltransferase 1 isoform X2 [Ipomoea nil]|uniref:probable protein S-acyltransferase 1 isoform X2 n=1 Tax=Ipomoea nil TaxID=35883 RepID=UPI000901D3AC|nr:PREDICTED: probable protein S-acyltransferase 1 isoform X2 [Ipomoea nil]
MENATAMNGIRNQDLAPSSIVDAPKKRLYQTWNGHNKFVCGGRLVYGPDGASMILSAFLIGTPAFTFCLKTLSRTQEADPVFGKVVSIVGIVLTILDLIFLFFTSSSNPGIIPRNKSPPEFDEILEASVTSMDWYTRATSIKLPRTKDVMVNGYSVKVKFCDTCLLYRPPRASHCSICNNCVDKFDHHCPWVGQCIGVRNYRCFLFFITTATILCIYVFTFSLMNLLHQRGSLLSRMSEDVVSAILVFYCFFAVWFVGGLSFFHFYLLSHNQTTYESFRYRYDKKENPFNRGLINNWKEVFLSKTAPSLVNFREWVVGEDETVRSSVRSVSYRFGGINSKNKYNLELGVVREDAILPNLDYNVIVDRLKEDGGVEKVAKGDKPKEVNSS